MLKHYKKLIVLLIVLAVGFCLALALGSAPDEPCEMCQLCKNKALVKEAILAVYENPDDPNLPEQFDPNYVHGIPQWRSAPVESPLYPVPSSFDAAGVFSFEFEYIIAEGDMVAVLVSWLDDAPPDAYGVIAQMAMFRIANGKIVEGWISADWYIPW